MIFSISESDLFNQNPKKSNQPKPDVSADAPVTPGYGFGFQDTSVLSGLLQNSQNTDDSRLDDISTALTNYKTCFSFV